MAAAHLLLGFFPPVPYEPSPILANFKLARVL